VLFRSAYVFLGPPSNGGLRQLIFSVAIPLTSNFLTMATATAITVVIGLFRLWRERDPNPKVRPSRPQRDRDAESGGREPRDRPRRDRASAPPRQPRSRDVDAERDEQAPPRRAPRPPRGEPRPERAPRDRGTPRPDRAAGNRSQSRDSATGRTQNAAPGATSHAGRTRAAAARRGPPGPHPRTPPQARPVRPPTHAESRDDQCRRSLAHVPRRLPADRVVLFRQRVVPN
jgi:hypothetical protein